MCLDHPVSFSAALRVLFIPGLLLLCAWPGARSWAGEVAGDKRPAPVTSELQGILTAYKGDRVTVSLSGRPASLPAGGSAASLYKRFKKDLGFIKASGWLEIARVTVLTASEKLLTLRITERKSRMKVNGKPVNHFQRGARVKLTWSPAEAGPAPR